MFHNRLAVLENAENRILVYQLTNQHHILHILPGNVPTTAKSLLTDCIGITNFAIVSMWEPNYHIFVK